MVKSLHSARIAPPAPEAVFSINAVLIIRPSSPSQKIAPPLVALDPANAALETVTPSPDTYNAPPLSLALPLNPAFSM